MLIFPILHKPFFEKLPMEHQSKLLENCTNKVDATIRLHHKLFTSTVRRGKKLKVS